MPFTYLFYIQNVPLRFDIQDEIAVPTDSRVTPGNLLAMQKFLVHGLLLHKQGEGAGVAQQLCNGLPHDGLGFESRLERCKNRAPCPSQGTVNGGGLLMTSLSMGH